ncbi:DUF305 domain-containing protein [Oryzobacter sp. R7]|uniref:DUF305 domain-containing protein n=1 Tax=Oryzobacter faecalis TaxID=3388656 RepID=UPI00398C8D0D
MTSERDDLGATTRHDVADSDAGFGLHADDAPRGSSVGASWALVAGAAVVALLLGVLGTLWLGGDRSSAPSDWSADAGFARDMQTHHHQAVEMAFLVYARTEDADVRTLAYDIATSQQQQAGQMYAWLRLWGLPQTGSREPMAWVGGQHADAHARPDGTMPGMASPAQLDELRAASGVEAERIFLRLMIDHHRGGVAMADAAVAEAGTQEVRTLASAIASAQTSEIRLLESMLAERS